MTVVPFRRVGSVEATRPASLPVTTLSEFKFWCIQKPGAHQLLREIIFRWRNCSARIPGDPLFWAVYPLVQWAIWLGWVTEGKDSAAAEKKVKRALRELEDVGLIERHRYPFAGKTFRAYLRPTRLALEHAGKPRDLERLGASGPPPSVPSRVPISDPMTVPTDVTMDVPMSVPTDLTPFPPLPSDSPNLPPSRNGSSSLRSGKGREGRPKVNNKTRLLPADASSVSATPTTPSALDRELLARESSITKNKSLKKAQKRAALLQHLPRQRGAHEIGDSNGKRKVVHPSELHRDRWHTWSAEKLIEKQLLYEDYVENWNQASGNKEKAARYSVSPGLSAEQLLQVEQEIADVQEASALRREWEETPEAEEIYAKEYYTRLARKQFEGGKLTAGEAEGLESWRVRCGFAELTPESVERLANEAQAARRRAAENGWKRESPLHDEPDATK